ncbi:unnamed protein product, partial [marine sediment metagenome]
SACWPTRDNVTMAEIVQSNIELVGMPEWTGKDQDLARRIQKAAEVDVIGLRTDISPLREARQSASSNDSGDITWTVPHGRVSFPANVPGVPFHHWAAGIAEATPIAHKGTVAGAKVMAGSVVDLLTTPELLQKAKETFSQEVAGSTYESLLPPDKKPPIGMNAAEMAKYREAMKAHYLKVPIRFK